MANPLLDAISGVGYALDTPGAYLRGVLAGSPGTRASGRDLLQAHGLTSDDDFYGGLKGLGTELLVDPLNWVGGGIAGHFLAHADEANPLLKGLRAFNGEELGAIGHPEALALMRSRDNPLGRMAALAEHTPARVSIDPLHQRGFEKNPLAEAFGGEDMSQAVAGYLPAGRTATGMTGPLVLPNLSHDIWGSNRLMSDLIRGAVGRGNLSVPKVRGHLDAIPVHEFGHAFHDQLLNTAADLGHDYRSQPIFKVDQFGPLGGQYPWNIGHRLRRSVETRLGPRATMNPQEFVAEAFADQVLGQTDLPRMLQGLYRDLGGPDVGALPAGFWDELRLTPRHYPGM